VIRRVMQQAVFASCALSLSATGSLAAGSKDQQAVLAAVRTLLDGWREADAEKLERALHPDFREVTLHLQNGEWNFTVVSRETLIKTMSKISKGMWDDRLVDPQVHVDGLIAVVWSHYRFTGHWVDEGVAHTAAHCGIETFQLYRIGPDWKIVNFADTHMDTCP